MNKSEAVGIFLTGSGTVAGSIATTNLSRKLVLASVLTIMTGIALILTGKYSIGEKIKGQKFCL